MKTKLFFLILSIFIIFLIARTSLGWAIVAGCSIFLFACWLHHEPDQYKRKRERDLRIARESREQQKLINE